MTEEKTRAAGKKIEISEAQLVQMAQNQEQQIAAQKELIERVGGALVETVTAKDILKEIQKHKGAINISVGATVLIEAEITNTKKCKRGIAENSYKEEEIAETIKWLEEKEKGLTTQVNAMQNEYAKMQGRLGDMVGILKQIEKEKKAAVTRGVPTISK